MITRNRKVTSVTTMERGKEKELFNEKDEKYKKNDNIVNHKSQQ